MQIGCRVKKKTVKSPIRTLSLEAAAGFLLWSGSALAFPTAFPVSPLIDCPQCQAPAPASAVGALELGPQIPGLSVLETAPGLGQSFGTFRQGQGIVPTQPPIVFPNLLSLSGGASPPAAPSWLDRVAPGALPANFSLAPRPLLDPSTITWDWGLGSPRGGSPSPYLTLDFAGASPWSVWQI